MVNVRFNVYNLIIFKPTLLWVYSKLSTSYRQFRLINKKNLKTFFKKTHGCPSLFKINKIINHIVKV